jgi:Predicted pyridoxal phosphate-dependent enzyme apparently involved in regulation of cell wall biogenesis
MVIKSYEKALRFADKNYNRLPDVKHAVREIEFLAPNYRMSELQGAVGLAQLDKLRWIFERRNEYGDGITTGIQGLPGIYPHKITEEGKNSYWFYMLRVNEKEARVSRDEFSHALNAEGIDNSAGYIPSCVYEYDIFLNKNVYPGTDCPFGCKLYGKDIKYYKGLCRNAEEILKTVIKIPVNEFFNIQDLKDVIEGIRKVADYYSNK